MTSIRTEYYKRWRAKRKRAGLCWHCPKRTFHQGVLCIGCARKQRSRNHQRIVTGCRYRRLFNLTLKEYQALLKFQKGRCFTCGERPKRKRKLAVDHCHKTQLIRGLLCWRCNSVLGKVKDSIELLSSLMAYLNFPPAFHVLGHRKVGKVRYGRIG
jgi:hypothetical protein